MTAMGDLDPARIGQLHAAELMRFRQARPRSLAMIARARAHMPNGVPMAWMAQDNDQPVYIESGTGPGFTDLDGFSYTDFNASDMAMFCGHAHPAIVAAVQAQVARSTQFLLPTQACVAVAELLASRYPVPQWQFTLSATQANTEAIRLARAVTGREVIVLFQGHYHGHFEEGLVDLADGQAVPVRRGLSKGVTGRVRIAQFNDVDTVRAALEPGDVALVLTEPAMTNNLHLLLPEPGWHQALRDLTRQQGTLLALDETHTHAVGPGGATGLWQLQPDIVTIGKAVAGGLPMGCQGGTDPGAGARGLRAHRRPGPPARRRHRRGHNRHRAALDRDPVRASLRAVVRTDAPHRGPGTRARRRQAHPPDPDLARQPRHLGRTARRGPDCSGPCHSRRGDPLR
jgi:glutamate-1-semialdehyde 2,1-aminomutase